MRQEDPELAITRRELALIPRLQEAFAGRRPPDCGPGRGGLPGVRCRRWNWHQARRTQLGEETTAAIFILDALDPMITAALEAAAEDLVGRLVRLAPGARVARA